MTKLQRVEARMLWSTNHYDGPINGVARTATGTPCWFSMLGGIYDNRKRRAYALYPLTDAEFLLEDQRQELFRKTVGMHCDYDTDGRRGASLSDVPQEVYSDCLRRMEEMRPPKEHNLYENRDPIGYFIPANRKTT